MKPFTVYSFDYPISRHRTKLLAKRKVEERIKIARISARLTRGEPVTYNLEAQHGKQTFYACGGYA